jgi:hypothetical protein
MNTIEGKIFKMTPAEEVLDFFKSRQRRKIEISPKKIGLINLKGNLFLRVSSNKIVEYPIRTSFLRKLLKWNSLPEDFSSKISDELFIKVLNETLQNFKAWNVDIHLENNEAKTITSKLYSEVTNMEIYDVVKDLEITKISHNDYMTRFFTKKKFEGAPIVNDQCGFGFDIVNSETGFAALAFNHFILRYVCTNGATAPINMYYWKQDHYAKDKNYLIDYIKNQIERADSSRNNLFYKIKKSNDEKSIYLKQHITSKLNGILNWDKRVAFINSFNWNGSKYDLFNYITDKAKPFDITKRYQLERLAGEIILN